MKGVEAEWERSECRKERRKQQEKSLMRMHTEEIEEMGEHAGAGGGRQGCCCSAKGQSEGMLHVVSG